MSDVRWTDLFAWEWRHVGRSRLLWLVAAVLTLAFAWGARSGAALHREQSAAIARALASDAVWRTQVDERAARYARANADAEHVLPYWQDPTDAAGFSRYFLREQATKPHLPSSPLAVGISDLMPSRLPVKLDTPFGIEPVYDFENPRSLGLGRFDLGFAVVYLLPMAVLVLVGLLATFERDHGMLRLIAAQRVGPRAWLGARLAAIAAWWLPVVAAGLTIALAAAGVEWSEAWRELAVALVLVVAYTVFWLALAAAVVAAWPSAAGAISVLTALWAALAIGLPLLGNGAAALHADAPAQVSYVDAQRRATDAIAAGRDKIVTAAFRADPLLANVLDRVSTIDYASRTSFLAPELERRLQPLRQRMDAARERRARWSDWIGFASPPLGVAEALSALAGTDAHRHARFEQQTRDYQTQLRGFFYPLIRQQIAAPTLSNPAASYGRMNFVAYDRIPAFRFDDADASARVSAVMPMMAWLLALSAGLLIVAGLRLRQWPMDRA